LRGFARLSPSAGRVTFDKTFVKSFPGGRITRFRARAAAVSSAAVSSGWYAPDMKSGWLALLARRVRN